MSNQVDEVEAVATAWAWEFSLEVGINQGILQGDSKVVMKSLAYKAQPLASFSTFINVNELHPNAKMKQYERVYLPSILVNLVCL